MRLLDRILAAAPTSRDSALSWDTFLNYFNYDGLSYALSGRQTLQNSREEFGSDYAGFAQYAYRQNGIIFGIIAFRMMVLSEGRFQFRELRQGRPGRLFGDRSLGLLETPWVGGTTGDLITRMEMDNCLAGNSYIARGAGRRVIRDSSGSARVEPLGRENELIRLKPDWVTVFLGSEDDPDAIGWDTNAQLLGYAYEPGGPGSGRPLVFYGPDEVAHYAPIPDPDAVFRGMSWLTPIVREIQGDQLATEHKLRYFENGGTPNIIVTLDVKDQAIYDLWVEAYRDKFERNPDSRFKTIILGAGAKPEVVGSNLQEIEFKSVQAGGETRMAVAGGVAPAILGISEGLGGSALNEGNYSAARRRTADGTLRPLWRNMGGSLRVVVPPPGGSELVVDERDVAFLREDEKDVAEVVSTNATAIRTFVDAGYTPESAVDAVESGDLSRLVHTGLFSVQLQPPGTSLSANGSSNGNGNAIEETGRALAALEEARQRVLADGGLLAIERGEQND